MQLEQDTLNLEANRMSVALIDPPARRSSRSIRPSESPRMSARRVEIADELYRRYTGSSWPLRLRFQIKKYSWYFTVNAAAAVKRLLDVMVSAAAAGDENDPRTTPPD